MFEADTEEDNDEIDVLMNFVRDAARSLPSTDPAGRVDVDIVIPGDDGFLQSTSITQWFEQIRNDMPDGPLRDRLFDDSFGLHLDEAENIARVVLLEALTQMAKEIQKAWGRKEGFSYD